MNISSRFRSAKMTGILKPYHHQEKLVLTSRRRKAELEMRDLSANQSGNLSAPLSETFLIEARMTTD